MSKGKQFIHRLVDAVQELERADATGADKEILAERVSTFRADCERAIDGAPGQVASALFHAEYCVGELESKEHERCRAPKLGCKEHWERFLIRTMEEGER